MMENTKVNMQSGNVRYSRNEGIVLENETEDELILHPSTLFARGIESWLNKECSVINQNDFDTCRGGYNNDVLDSLQGYRPRYNTYLDQFENC